MKPIKAFIICTACILICPILFLILIYFDWIAF